MKATAHEPRIASVNLVQADFPRLKEKNRILLALAVVRLCLNDKSGVAGLLEEIDKAQSNDWVRYGVEFTRAQLEGRPVNPDNLPSSATKRAPRAPVIPLLEIGKLQM
ncbi:MAG TPA: hypothetical protein VKC51_05080 [Lacunisphaera sp.]|nr:hypothetical protein [Lacunisphaera sp.]